MMLGLLHFYVVMFVKNSVNVVNVTRILECSVISRHMHTNPNFWDLCFLPSVLVLLQDSNYSRLVIGDFYF